MCYLSAACSNASPIFEHCFDEAVYYWIMMKQLSYIMQIFMLLAFFCKSVCPFAPLNETPAATPCMSVCQSQNTTQNPNEPRPSHSADEDQDHCSLCCQTCYPSLHPLDHGLIFPGKYQAQKYSQRFDTNILSKFKESIFHPPQA
jgi:hypothetical protein